MSARIFNFKIKPDKALDKLTINKGQLDMVMQYAEACQIAADDEKTAEQFASIQNMIWCFCQPEEK